MRNLYEVLGVTRDASKEEIRARYKEKAGKFHPDKNPDNPNATAAFQELQHAYAILKDSDKRKRYDETGQTDGNAPTLDESANGIIVHVFLAKAEEAGFAPGDYVLETTRAIQNVLRRYSKESALHEKSHSRLKYIIDNTAASEVTVEGLTAKLFEIERELANAKQGCAVMTRALEMLADCRYTGKVGTPQQGSNRGFAEYPDFDTVPYVD